MLITHHSHFLSCEQTNNILSARGHDQIHLTGGSFWQGSRPLSLS